VLSQLFTSLSLLTIGSLKQITVTVTKCIAILFHKNKKKIG